MLFFAKDGKKEIPKFYSLNYLKIVIIKNLFK